MAPANTIGVDADHLRMSATTLVARRAQRAQSRQAVRAGLDAMAAEARRYLGAAFTTNDPVTGFPVALVVRSDERLPDDYDAQTPRPPADTLSRLIVDVLGHAITIEADDAGTVRASGNTMGTPIGSTRAIRIDAAGSVDAATFLVPAGDDAKAHEDIPFVRVLAELIDAAVQDERRFAAPADSVAHTPAS
jgi:hypothetical protein